MDGNFGYMEGLGERLAGAGEPVDPPQQRARREAKRCNIYGHVCEEHWIDGRTKAGMWANMCVKCHGIFGVGLGTGRGQKFDAATGLKVEG